MLTEEQVQWKQAESLYDGLCCRVCSGSIYAGESYCALLREDGARVHMHRKCFGATFPVPKGYEPGREEKPHRNWWE